MSKQFTDLRVHLEHAAVQPDFDQLRARRHQRTQRYAIGAVVAALVVALLGVGIAIQALRPSAAPAPGSSLTVSPTAAPTSPAPSATSTTPSSAPSSATAASGPALSVASAANSGSTLVLLATGCTDVTCGQYVWQLRTSTDGAKTWQTRTLPFTTSPESARMYVTGDGYTWIVIPARGEIVAVPPNGGAQVDLTGLSGVGPSSWPLGSVAGDVLWVGWGQQVFRVAASPTVAAKPVLTTAGPVVTVAAASGTTALVGVEVPNTTQPGDIGKWSLTSNSGQSFATVGDPCAGTPFPGSFDVTVSFGGSAAWATCTGGGGTGLEPKTMTVSTDLRHWTVRGNVESGGYATNVVAFSTTAAWRYGDRAEIYRTTDGQHWTSVGSPTDGPKAFVAFDIDHAVYLGNEDTDQLYWYATTDGGTTWTRTPFNW